MLGAGMGPFGRRERRGVTSRRSGGGPADGPVHRLGNAARDAGSRLVLCALVAGLLLVCALPAGAQPRELKDLPPDQETAKFDLGLFELDLGKGHWVWEPTSRKTFCLSLGVSSGLSILLTNLTIVGLVGLTDPFLLRIAKIAAVPALMGATWAVCGAAAGALPDWGSFPPWSRGPAPDRGGPFLITGPGARGFGDADG